MSTPAITIPDRVAFTLAEVSELTRIGRTKLYSEVRSGRLKIVKIVKIGRRTVVRPEAVRAWLAAAEVQR